jgi:hypothetical protein
LKEAGLLVQRGKITAVGRALAAPAGALEIDATGKHVTPGLIAPSHVAISRGGNEFSHSVRAEVRIADVLDATSIDLYRQLAGGLTAVNVLHGSANTGRCPARARRLQGGRRDGCHRRWRVHVLRLVGFKIEVVDAVPANAALMHRAGVLTSFNSDAPELARRLNTEAAKAVKYGSRPDDFLARHRIRRWLSVSLRSVTLGLPIRHRQSCGVVGPQARRRERPLTTSHRRRSPVLPFRPLQLAQPCI